MRLDDISNFILGVRRSVKEVSCGLYFVCVYKNECICLYIYSISV